MCIESCFFEHFAKSTIALIFILVDLALRKGPGGTFTPTFDQHALCVVSKLL